MDGWSGAEAEERIDGEGQDAEEEMTGDLRRSLDPDMTTPIAVLQSSVHPFDARALLEAFL